MFVKYKCPYSSKTRPTDIPVSEFSVNSNLCCTLKFVLSFVRAVLIKKYIYLKQRATQTQRNTNLIATE
jgi:hypothetical protein